MIAKDIMTRRIVSVRPEATVAEAVRAMLDNAGVHTERIGDSTGKLDAVFRA